MLHRVNREIVNTVGTVLRLEIPSDKLPRWMIRPSPPPDHHQYCTLCQCAERFLRQLVLGADIRKGKGWSGFRLMLLKGQMRGIGRLNSD
jgi:hypothetical protein